MEGTLPLFLKNKLEDLIIVKGRMTHGPTAMVACGGGVFLPFAVLFPR